MHLCAEGPGRARLTLLTDFSQVLRRRVILSFWVSLKVPLKKGSKMSEQRSERAVNTRQQFSSPALPG